MVSGTGFHLVWKPWNTRIGTSMNAADLYAQAYKLQYEQNDHEAALAIYNQLLSEYWHSPEAGYAITQLSNIGSAPAVQPKPSAPAPTTQVPATTEPRPSGSVSPKFAFWFLVIASSIVVLFVYLSMSDNGAGRRSAASDGFTKEREAFVKWRAGEYPGGAMNKGEYVTNGCTFGAVGEAEGNSRGHGMSMDVSLSVVSGALGFSGLVVFVPSDSGWRCDRGTVRTSSGDSIPACPPVGAWCKESIKAPKITSKTTPAVKPVGDGFDFWKARKSSKPDAKYDKSSEKSCLDWAGYTVHRGEECGMNMREYWREGLCRWSHERKSARKAFTSKNCKSLEREVLKRRRKLAKFDDTFKGTKRRQIAESLDILMIKLGMEGSARAQGKTLIIEYALCSRVFYDRLLNEDILLPAGQLRGQLTDAGFTQMKCNDGYSTVTGEL